MSAEFESLLAQAKSLREEHRRAFWNDRDKAKEISAQLREIGTQLDRMALASNDPKLTAALEAFDRENFPRHQQGRGR